MDRLQIKLNETNFEKAEEFAEKRLKAFKISKTSINETLIIFEEIFLEAVHQNKPDEPEAVVEVKNIYGEVNLNLLFEGKRLVTTDEKVEEYRNIILEGYRDKFYCRYSRGNNKVTITAAHNRSLRPLFHMAILLFAVIICAVMNAIDPDLSYRVFNKDLFPIEAVFGNLMQMLSTPLAFFCLISNITTLKNSDDDSFSIGKNMGRIAQNSIVAIAIGMLIFIAILGGPTIINTSYNNSAYHSTLGTFEHVILDLFPDSISGIFSSSTSLSFIIFAIITSQAICLSGKYFDALKMMTDAIYTLLSKILSMIMPLLPFVYFLALGENMSYTSISATLYHYFAQFVIVVAAVAIMFLIKCIRIVAVGGELKPFLKSLKPAINVNLYINSSIDSAPYNIRYFSSEGLIPIKKLKTDLPVLAEMSQCGNCLCYAIMGIAILYMTDAGYNAGTLALIAIMSLFLGIGAPGQPGSIASGMIVMCTLLGFKIEDVIGYIIISEVSVEWLATLVNTFDDIFELYIETEAEKKSEVNAES